MQGISNHHINEERLTERQRVGWGLNTSARHKPGVRRVQETVDVDSGLRPKLTFITKRRFAYRRAK